MGETGPKKLVGKHNCVRAERSAGECSDREQSRSWHFPLGSHERAASEGGSRGAPLPLRSDHPRRKDHQRSGVHRTRQRAGRPGTQRPARLQRFAGRFHPATPVQAQRALFFEDQRGLLQHLQSPQLRSADQLYDLSAVRFFNANSE